jgi:hypothetical protein
MFWKLPLNSTQRVKLWWAEVVMGSLYPTADNNGCLPLTKELYHIVPFSGGYLRDGSSHSLYSNFDLIVDLADIEVMLPFFLEQHCNLTLTGFEFEFEDKLSRHSHVSSGTSQAAVTLLLEDEAMRASIDAFYAQDFSCFKFRQPDKGPAAISRLFEYEPSAAAPRTQSGGSVWTFIVVIFIQTRN